MKQTTDLPSTKGVCDLFFTSFFATLSRQSHLAGFVTSLSIGLRHKIADSPTARDDFLATSTLQIAILTCCASLQSLHVSDLHRHVKLFLMQSIRQCSRLRLFCRGEFHGNTEMEIQYTLEDYQTILEACPLLETVKFGRRYNALTAPFRPMPDSGCLRRLDLVYVPMIDAQFIAIMGYAASSLTTLSIACEGDVCPTPAVLCSGLARLTELESLHLDIRRALSDPDAVTSVDPVTSESYVSPIAKLGKLQTLVTTTDALPFTVLHHLPVSDLRQIHFLTYSMPFHPRPKALPRLLNIAHQVNHAEPHEVEEDEQEFGHTGPIGVFPAEVIRDLRALCAASDVEFIYTSYVYS